MAGNPIQPFPFEFASNGNHELQDLNQDSDSESSSSRVSSSMASIPGNLNSNNFVYQNLPVVDNSYANSVFPPPINPVIFPPPPSNYANSTFPPPIDPVIFPLPPNINASSIIPPPSNPAIFPPPNINSNPITFPPPPSINANPMHPPLGNPVTFPPPSHLIQKTLPPTDFPLPGITKMTQQSFNYPPPTLSNTSINSSLPPNPPPLFHHFHQPPPPPPPPKKTDEFKSMLPQIILPQTKNQNLPPPPDIEKNPFSKPPVNNQSLSTDAKTEDSKFLVQNSYNIYNSNLSDDPQSPEYLYDSIKFTKIKEQELAKNPVISGPNAISKDSKAPYNPEEKKSKPMISPKAPAKVQPDVSPNPQVSKQQNPPNPNQNRNAQVIPEKAAEIKPRQKNDGHDTQRNPEENKFNESGYTKRFLSEFDQFQIKKSFCEKIVCRKETNLNKLLKLSNSYQTDELMINFIYENCNHIKKDLIKKYSVISLYMVCSLIENQELKTIICNNQNLLDIIKKVTDEAIKLLNPKRINDRDIPQLFFVRTRTYLFENFRKGIENFHLSAIDESFFTN